MEGCLLWKKAVYCFCCRFAPVFAPHRFSPDREGWVWGIDVEDRSLGMDIGFVGLLSSPPLSECVGMGVETAVKEDCDERRESRKGLGEERSDE